MMDSKILTAGVWPAYGTISKGRTSPVRNIAEIYVNATENQVYLIVTDEDGTEFYMGLSNSLLDEIVASSDKCREALDKWKLENLRGES